MDHKKLNRRMFVLSGLGATLPSPLRCTVKSSRLQGAMNPRVESDAAAAQGEMNSGSPRIIPMLYGSPRPETDLDSWFAAMKSWGVKQWMPFALPEPIHYLKQNKHSQSVAFFADAWPGFKPHLDLQNLAEQEAFFHKMEKLSVANGMEFWYLIPFPIFPSRDPTVVKAVVPELFKSGNLNLYDPRVPELMKAEIRALKKGMPSLKGVNVWLAEGAGVWELTREDLRHNKEWEGPLIKALNDVAQELGIQATLFSHHYLHTVRTRRNVYELMADYPELILLEDITWPEEDMLHPYLGYLNASDRKLLFQTNPVAVNYLIDTEYIGEGVLPSVYPRWWKHNVQEAVRSGAQIAMGRTFFWDEGYTDVNFNRLNAHIFVRLCYEPDADLRQLLGDAAREMFGVRIPQRLVDILWETEPILKSIIGINGVDSLDHSRFPHAFCIDVLYSPWHTPMKAIDDLFSPPGTVLYPPYSDELINFKQWRWENRIVSQPAEVYLSVKREAIAWVEKVLPEVRQLSQGLEPRHRDMFVNGYEIMEALAKGMELFVETASVHYQWAHAKTLDDPAARAQFEKLADSWRALAATVPPNPFLYKERMLELAEFIEKDLPRISPDYKLPV